MSPQARAARFFNKFSSGWARPLKYKKKIYMLTASGLWDIVGSMTDIKKALDSTYLKGQVIALMKLSANIQSTINKLEAQIKEEEENNASNDS